MKLNKIIIELKRYKKGLIVGAVVGFAAAWYAVSQGVDLLPIARAGKGAIDIVMSRSAPLEIAKYKFYGTYMFLGALVGYLADRFIRRR